MADGGKKPEASAASGLFSGLFGGREAAPAGAKAGARSTETNPEDIPKEDLLHLCMKMNKRMQALESKGADMAKKLKDSTEEKKQLFDIIKTYISIPITFQDQDTLDLTMIREKVMLQGVQTKDAIKTLEDRIAAADREHAREIANMESKMRKEITMQANKLLAMSGTDSGTGEVAANAALLSAEVERVSADNEVIN
jgi:hypothetical protein